MNNDDVGPSISDPDLDTLLSELLTRAEKEQIPVKLRRLARQLEEALEAAKSQGASNGAEN